MSKYRLVRVLSAVTIVLALILDELWRMGRLREWTWEWAVIAVCFAVIVFETDRMRREK